MNAQFSAALLGLAQAVLILVLSPAFYTLIRKFHGRIQGRKGPRLLQGYYDLFKLLKKDRIYADRSSYITRITPMISLAVVCVAATMIPVIGVAVPFHFSGGFIAFIYLFALSRFLTALTGLDSGSTFGGMAASREMTLSSLAEPAILLCFIVVSDFVRSMDIPVMTEFLVKNPGELINPFFVLSSVSFFIVILAENGRVPVDNPATHLELTMVHEGMVLELSGRDLAIFQWAHATRLLVMVIAAIDLFLPFGISTTSDLDHLGISLGVLLFKLFIAAGAIAYIETANAKMRLFRVPDLLTLAFVLSMVSLVALFIIGGRNVA